MEALRQQRLQRVRDLLSRHALDAVLLFGTRKDSSYLQWVFGVRPRVFTYCCVTQDAVVFLEIDYNIRSLRALTDHPIEATAEDTVVHDLAGFLKPFSRIGLIGPSPFSHLGACKKDIVVLDHEADEWLIEKSDDEVRGILESATSLKEVFALASAIIKPGTSEGEVAQQLRLLLLERGEELAFPITVLSGDSLRETTAGTPTDRRFADDDLICVDMGLLKNGFASDCTRFFFLGNHEAKEPYAALVQAHHATIASLSSGMPIRDVVQRYKDALKSHGLPAESLVVADLGHSIGYNVHEYPFLYREDHDRYSLIDNMVCALEPEIVFPEFRLRIEDMVLFRDGKPVILT